MKDLKALTEVCDKATPGPWLEGSEHGVIPRLYVVKNGHSKILEHLNVTAVEPGKDFYHFKPEDLTFIATFNPSTVKELLDEIRSFRVSTGMDMVYEQHKILKDRLEKAEAVLVQIYEEPNLLLDPEDEPEDEIEIGKIKAWGMARDYLKEAGQ